MSKHQCTEYTGGCLCGFIGYKTSATPTFPHLCSCSMCRKSSGALTVAWLVFPINSFMWTNGREPTYYASSQKTKRGFCPKCGGALCAIDEGSKDIAMTIASLDNPELVIPGTQHSFEEAAPTWWKVNIER